MSVEISLKDLREIHLAIDFENVNKKEVLSALSNESLEIISSSDKRISLLINQVSSIDTILDKEMVVSFLQSFTQFFTIQIIQVVNDQMVSLNSPIAPLWKQDPSTANQSDYQALYESIFQSQISDEAPPWLFVKTYDPIAIEGVLFFKKFNPHRVIGDDHKVKVLVEQALVSEDFSSKLLPDFFKDTFGVLEITDKKYEDISKLVCSHEFKELSKEIILNVANSIKRLNRKNRADYEVLWPYISNFVKKACLSDESFDQVMRPHILYKMIDGSLKTIDEILINEDKRAPQTIYYYDNTCVNPVLVKKLEATGIRCIEIDSFLDPLFIQSEEANVRPGGYLLSFESLEMAVLSQGKKENQNSTELEKILESFFKNREQSFLVPNIRGSLNLEVRSYDETTPEIIFLIDESSRRAFYNTRFTVGIDSWPLDITAVINSEHPRVQRLFQLGERERNELIELMYSSSSRHIWPQTPSPRLDMVQG